MAAESSVEAGAPNLNLNPEEKRVYGQLFRQADTDGVGVVTGEIAVKFFEKTRLDSRILGEIWQISDKENRGFLTPAGFGIVLRLIGHAQAGREPTPELALQQGPIPRFDGFTPQSTGGSVPVAAPPAAAAAAPIQAQGTGGGPIRIPPLTPEKVSQYANLFERQSLQSGNLLPGEQAKQIFEKSGLPNDVLGRIWMLADTEQRGALVQTEFVIAMHLLTSMKTGALRGLPTILPAALYEAATRRGGAAPRQSPTGTGPTISAIPRQLSGQAQYRPSSPLSRAPLSAQGTGIASQTTGSDWLITPQDKARFDQLYADLDKTGKGYITGNEAVPFFSQSNLSEDALAQIWDLADVNSEGILNKDTFAVAMYLIRQQRGRRDGANLLPATLPLNLIPPSLRNQAKPTTGASPFDAPTPAVPQQPPQAPLPQPKSALEDLFGLDSPAPAPTQTAAATGGSAAKDPFSSGAPASPVQASPTGNVFKPFVPSSSFGRSLQPQGTGGSAGSAPARSAPTAMEDLLGGDDAESNNKISNDSVELANLSNQIGSLSKQMQQVQGQRATTQTELNQANEQKKNFEQRLSQLRSLYEKEAGDVRGLEEQLKQSRDDTRKLTGEMVTLDGQYQDVQKQHQQLLTALQADQQENANLKQRISAVNAEIAQLKPQIEKLKSDARQHKGLVAINKKQLSTVESERDRLKSEADDLTRNNEELSRSANTSSPVSNRDLTTSPTPSVTGANNPFFRRTGSTDIMGTFASPALKPHDKTFDDIFGGYTSGSASGTPPPPTSFKAQDTGASSASAGSFGTPAGPTPTVSRQATTLGEGSGLDVPPPPASRQISSSFLPFGGQSESLTSSRAVSPPLSRSGAEGGGPGPLQPNATGTSVASGTSSTKVAVGEPFDEKPTPGTNGGIPGAFPSDETPKAIETTTSPFGGVNDDPFGSVKKEPTNAKDDFESAFASFGTSSKAPEKKAETSNAFSSFATEFPPISELERDDDDSDTASEGNGFDDDFAPTSPPNKGEKKSAPSSPVASKPAPAATTAAGEGAQPIDKPSPPEPTTIAPVTQTEDDPFAPSPSTLTNTAPVASTSNAFPILATSNTAVANPTTIASKSTGNAFDDLEDEFEGLEDAKEGADDDEYANISRSGLDDFNPVFDSSPPRSQVKSENTGLSNAFGTESSYDFGSVSGSGISNAGASANTTTAPSGVADTSAKGPNAPESHDWDAIFATLDSPSAATAADTTQSGGATANGTTEKVAERPGGPGRALTEDGTHDDPILKNLTSMGYSRTDAVSALEKYDYNLERAANYLASQS